MQLPDPQVYTLNVYKPQVGERTTYTYQVVLNGAERKGFAQPATLKCPKLYVVTQRQEIHYVGVTNSPMSARINGGLKATGKHGYHGYEWKTIRTPLTLFVWSFSGESGESFLQELVRALEPKAGKLTPEERALETVEAEFTFLVRKETDHWPMSQTEIHFHQSKPAHRAATSAMWDQVTRHEERFATTAP